MAIACLLLAACTTTNVRNAALADTQAPRADSRGLLLQPDVQLGLLTAAGLQEAREDWSREAQSNLSIAIGDELRERSHPFEVLDPQASMEGRTGQLLRLHEAIGQSVIAFEYTGMKLPTKKGVFDWTLGPGTQSLRDARHADYALFVTARGTYASTGRKVLMVGAAVFGVALPLGNQQVYASLVDLRTGRLVWFNVANAGPSADMRSLEGARSLSQALLKSLPL